MTVEQAFTQYIEARDMVLSPATIRGYMVIRDTRPQSIMHMTLTQLKLNDIQRCAGNMKLTDEDREETIASGQNMLFSRVS